MQLQSNSDMPAVIKPAYLNSNLLVFLSSADYNAYVNHTGKT